MYHFYRKLTVFWNPSPFPLGIEMGGSLREICAVSIRRGGVFLTGLCSKPSCAPSTVGWAAPCILKTLLATGQSVTQWDSSCFLHAHLVFIDEQNQMLLKRDLITDTFDWSLLEIFFVSIWVSTIMIVIIITRPYFTLLSLGKIIIS